MSINDDLKSDSILLEEKCMRLQSELDNLQKVACIGHYVFDITTASWESSAMLDEIFGIGTQYDRNIKGWLEVIDPDQRQELSSYLLTHVIANKQKFDKEYRIIRISDKQVRWVHGLGDLKYNDQGEPIGMFGVIQDITDRKILQNELTAQKDYLRQIIDSVPVFICIKHRDGHYTLGNKALANAYGTTVEGLIGKTDYDFTPNKEEIESFLKDDFEVINSKSVKIIQEEPITQNDGTVHWIKTIKLPLFEMDGSCNQLIAVAMDITELKQSQNQLIIATEKAQESDRLKTAFLQNMSHEIRTPMNAIIGFSDLLFTHFDDKIKLKMFADIISQRSNDLLDIINDILDIAKIESGQLSVNLEECNLIELFAELSAFFSEYQTKIRKQHIILDIRTECEPTAYTIITDKVKLNQILINLISNAFKFTDKGSIKTGCKFGVHGKVEFFVSDTGVGIPDEKKQIIFERFAQLHDDLFQNASGTGLGLPIVKGLVELLGGEVTLQSEVNMGSVFTFTIPYTSKT